MRDYDYCLKSEGFGIHYIWNSMRIPFSLRHTMVHIAWVLLGKFFICISHYCSSRLNLLFIDTAQQRYLKRKLPACAGGFAIILIRNIVAPREMKKIFLPPLLITEVFSGIILSQIRWFPIEINDANRRSSNG